MVERVPPVPALDPGGALGEHHGRLERKRGGAARPANDRQHGHSRAPLGSGR